MQLKIILQRIADQPLGILRLTASGIVASCVAALFIAILINFSEARSDVQRERRSIVETGSMTVFFIAIYLVIVSRIGAVRVEVPWIVISTTVLGTSIIVLGTVMNIWGRLHLKGNWANQVRIYVAQTLVRTGPYRFVRHPLYASLIWMFFGASLVYVNWLAAILTVLIFIPFMRRRALLEEQVLLERFPEYAAYRKTTGMFFVRLIPWHR